MPGEVWLGLLAVISAIIGFLVAWLVQNAKKQGLNLLYQQQLRDFEQLRQLQATLIAENTKYQNDFIRANTLYTQNQLTVAQLQKQWEDQNALLYKTTEEKAALFAQVKVAREKLDNQQNDILRLREQFRLEFSELAQKILDENSKKFADNNELRIRQILEPLKTNISEFKQRVEETYDKESKERFSLGREVQKLIEMSAVVSQEANNLATALKGNNKIQGNWGEMILESMLANSGLSRGREYQLQEFIKDSSGDLVRDENGRALQPDVTIYYPDQRKIIIDSKVSLTAWEQCLSCSDPAQHKTFLHEHIRSIRQHIDGLSRKNYPKYAVALDYVLLFIPIEPAFLEALKTDLQVWKYAYDKKILLVSPTNLFAVLKIIADLWKVEQQNRHAIDIAAKAGALYEKFTGFIENMEIMGRKLEDATHTYNSAFKQLSTGRGNLISKVEELKKMGAATGKSLPERLLQADDHNAGQE